jgi:hypothetical protein
MSWREDNDVDFLVGLAKNNRLAKEIEEEMAFAKALYQCSCKRSTRRNRPAPFRESTGKFILHLPV